MKRMLIAAGIMVSVGCGGPIDEVAETDAAIVALDACPNAPSDATFSVSQGPVLASSLALDYSDPARRCRRYVADFIVPSGNWVFYSGFADDNLGHGVAVTEAECPHTTFSARTYRRVEHRVSKNGLIFWEAEPFVAVDTFTGTGFFQAGRCVYTGGGGAQASFDEIYDGPNYRLRVRVAVEAQVEGSDKLVPVVASGNPWA